ncbi:23S rRNA m(5)U-1939 methyltransferase [Colwellia chukchiensis]|uniref:23S rRNA (uracil(1939)-C(5))-methyltransferase RlmD n=1 Tax=Colwellia chukchiensis TaxID=641665 RepID=A0A1H7JC14_9GAMM|nr:23S rRNA (uracil(1939)-C(5))-methyltransferase RlmD [Colwellia chukchiensis]SEK72211.1 23S rRNA m(5)U-1939 methyltransferase [Colwellia chukchiensis]
MVQIFKASSKKTQVKQNLTVTVQRLDQHGCGVAVQGKKAVFIDGALPGETVQVQVYEQKSKFLKAKLQQVITESEARVAVKCRHFYHCGGCNLQHLAYQQQLTYKQDKVSQLFAREGINIALPWQSHITSQPWQYRRKARIGVQYNKQGNAIIGFRRRASNDLTTITSCPVLDAAFADIFTELTALLPKLSGKNAIGHVEVIAANANVVVVRQLLNASPQDKQHWQDFAKKNNYLVYLDDGKQLTALSDDQPLHYRVTDTLTIEFSVNDFIQINHKVNQQMVAQAQAWLALKPQDRVLDLFSGLGNFSLPIAQQVQAVVGIEGVPAMVAKAQNNAKRNGIDNCQFYQADLNSDWHAQPWVTVKYTKALLDPARAGAYQAIRQLLLLNIKSILYVSCDPATLARDAKLLLSHGYKVEKIALIDMFSQTKHVETMVMFSL